MYEYSPFLFVSTVAFNTSLMYIFTSAVDIGLSCPSVNIPLILTLSSTYNDDSLTLTVIVEFDRWIFSGSIV